MKAIIQLISVDPDSAWIEDKDSIEGGIFYSSEYTKFFEGLSIEPLNVPNYTFLQRKVTVLGEFKVLFKW